MRCGGVPSTVLCSVGYSEATLGQGLTFVHGNTAAAATHPESGKRSVEYRKDGFAFNSDAHAFQP